MKIEKKGTAADFKGNKSTLLQKLCKRCGRVMVWRKSWAKNWASVQFCSDRCRKNKAPFDL